MTALASLPAGRWLLAVSGGRDSMVLLDAMARLRLAEIVAVATFDHCTGVAARRAVELVAREGKRRGLRVIRGALSMDPSHATEGLSRARRATEASWREARWRFLDEQARALDATLVTAHTQDDQVETVLQRLLRGSGVRGLAGMLAWSRTPGGARVVRPLLGIGRESVESYAAAHEVPWVEDPSNAGRAHGRNRVRHDLLPALERASPGFAEWCLDLSARATAWRRSVEELLDRLGALAPGDGSVLLGADVGAELDAAAWRVIWPALAARAGVAMDWRGVERAAEWAPRAVVGARIPLSGAASIERTSRTFVLRAGRGADDRRRGNDAERP